MSEEAGVCLVDGGDGETSGRLDVCSILHAASCKQEECVERQCRVVKQMFKHLRDCRYPSIGCCLSCNQFRALLIQHAATCCVHSLPNGSSCPVPECAKLKHLMTAHMDGETKPRRQGTHWPRQQYPHRSDPEVSELDTPLRESSTSAGGHRVGSTSSKDMGWQGEEPPTGGGTLSSGPDPTRASHEGTPHGEPVVSMGGSMMETEDDRSAPSSRLHGSVAHRDTPPSPSLPPTSFEAFLMCDVPYDYLCPVSLTLLTDPVVAADGITYQRECLEQCINWSLKRGDKSFRSPMTGLPMNPIFLPNVTVRRQVLEFKEDRAGKWRASRGGHAPMEQSQS